MNKKQLQTLEDFENRNPEKLSFFVDPATIGMIVSAAKFAYETWGKKKSDNDKWLKEISKQLAEIKRLLIGVTKALDLLRVHIDSKFEELISTGLIAKIQTIEANNSHWRRNNDRYLQNTQTQKEIQELLFDLQPAVRQLMQYGYGHYDTIAFAMRIELYLTMISNRHSSSVNKVIETYKYHFTECLDVKMKNSLAFSLDTIEKEINQIKAETQEGRFLVRSYEERKGEDIYLIQQFQIIKGTLETGFSMTPERTERYVRSTGRRDGPVCGRCLVEKFSEGEFEFSSKFKTNDFFAVYQQRHLTFKEVLNPNKLALIKASEMVTNYINQLNAYLAE
ncbi:hypothetical protein [Flavobacterium aurantiibacter]|uniref:Uncharacterized protein n=1 Tax=Flavobacterium aurantiibacter TaxID=2023067 RepID=A0A255ZYI9_9FLAO|nr:hypothetical protein [Flavobacterium aurantiibacter]OYQ45934.1 hypothetical protein CHX27_05530 [Flavobacterium aurantiibacter]